MRYLGDVRNASASSLRNDAGEVHELGDTGDALTADGEEHVVSWDRQAWPCWRHDGYLPALRLVSGESHVLIAPGPVVGDRTYPDDDNRFDLTRDF